MKMRLGAQQMDDTTLYHSHKWEFYNGYWSCDCGVCMAVLPEERFIEGIVQGTKKEVIEFLQLFKHVKSK
jgi:hypothetical protein